MTAMPHGNVYVMTVV